jgi:nucleoside 2-deoxyribosyltransferase
MRVACPRIAPERTGGGQVKSIYLIGALKNRKISILANKLRKLNFEVVDDWLTPGPHADTYLLKYEKGRGHGYKEALNGLAANHIYSFDKFHIDRCDIGILVMPAGKSGHLELGYMRGSGKPGYILFPKEPPRFDLMHKLATDVFFSEQDLFDALQKEDVHDDNFSVGAVSGEGTAKAVRSERTERGSKSFISLA